MNWISIKDKQPEGGQIIIAAEVVGNEVEMLYGTAIYLNPVWVCAYGEDDIVIDYWMPEEDLIATLPIFEP